MLIRIINAFVQSTWTVEYTDCFSAEELDPANQCPVYDIKKSDDEFPVMRRWKTLGRES